MRGREGGVAVLGLGFGAELLFTAEEVEAPPAATFAVTAATITGFEEFDLVSNAFFTWMPWPDADATLIAAMNINRDMEMAAGMWGLGNLPVRQFSSFEGKIAIRNLVRKSSMD